ncbi:FkbM family methyltransferase [Desulfitobacterium sp. LBE]|uniref:FkbM family methyltransferase n=1 Tax=Desulfitobacterium sp. LBE TaxID=884086 RepID=UPI0011A416AB|nr:FkbM family methyltransferase [Desulfitobacterium sp. LBE]
MNSFKQKFEEIKAQYNKHNPFNAIVEKKELFSQKPLILYGYGVYSSTIISLCNELGIEIDAICDSYKTGIYGDMGMEIISPERLKNEFRGANIIISSNMFSDEIKKSLLSLGFSDTQIYLPTISKVSFVHPQEFINEHLEGYEWAYHFFTDDNSKKVLLDRIRMYFTGIELVRTSAGPEYFDPEIIKLHSNEVFIDGGCYIGDTVQEFTRQLRIKNTGGHKHIYSFEPDIEAYNKALNNLGEIENIDLFCKGLWSCDTELKFYSDGGNGSSTFANRVNTISVPVISLDSFLGDKPHGELPTFIKMDIEGAEKEALMGAQKIIREKHPKLAICAYHKPEDIYELPKLIYDIDPTYKFYLHQCENGIYGTILYAI